MGGFRKKLRGLGPTVRRITSVQAISIGYVVGPMYGFEISCENARPTVFRTRPRRCTSNIEGKF